MCSPHYTLFDVTKEIEMQFIAQLKSIAVSNTDEISCNVCIVLNRVGWVVVCQQCSLNSEHISRWQCVNTYQGGCVNTHQVKFLCSAVCWVAVQCEQILYQCRPLSSFPSSRVNQIHGTAGTNKIHLLQPFTTSLHPLHRAVAMHITQCALHCTLVRTDHGEM